MNHRGSPSPMGWSVSRCNGLFRQRQALWGHLPRLSKTEFASAGESGLQHRAAVRDLVIDKEEVSTEAKGFDTSTVQLSNVPGNDIVRPEASAQPRLPQAPPLRRDPALAYPPCAPA